MRTRKVERAIPFRHHTWLTWPRIRIGTVKDLNYVNDDIDEWRLDITNPTIAALPDDSFTISLGILSLTNEPEVVTKPSKNIIIKKRFVSSTPMSSNLVQTSKSSLGKFFLPSFLVGLARLYAYNSFFSSRVQTSDFSLVVLVENLAYQFRSLDKKNRRVPSLQTRVFLDKEDLLVCTGLYSFSSTMDIRWNCINARKLASSLTDAHGSYAPTCDWILSPWYFVSSLANHVHVSFSFITHISTSLNQEVFRLRHASAQ